ncbi:CppA N-terminal domain-containing protein [Streptococcus phocae subsp. phocae]|uniref:Peptidase n=1 Tax=Streptococcus phocae TaxID=119224 RepID=A0A0P6SDJ4_9STRE|nr:CppA N-terminal domain-containing protein [Streptococcus phocae]KGR73375.1 peptidase [Streptococcus phocae subsp. salmonis]KPJ22172.1 peptidase [Streptococcus phocae]
MTLFEHLVFKTPVLRVNNRDLNIAFYQNMLGFRLVSEENAIAIFSSWGQGKERFVIEESPANRTRAVNGPKKVNTIVVKTTEPKDIVQLLARATEPVTVYKGEKGYAFETLSPEGDRFLVHAEDNLDRLTISDKPDVDKDPSFKGLSQFTFDRIVLNVPDQVRAQAFYQDIFGNNLPIALDFETKTGSDLTIAPHIAWDLEILEFQLPADADLPNLKSALEAKGHQVYLDKKNTVLVVSDPSQIEIWFVK